MPALCDMHLLPWYRYQGIQQPTGLLMHACKDVQTELLKPSQPCLALACTMWLHPVNCLCTTFVLPEGMLHRGQLWESPSASQTRRASKPSMTKRP